MDVTTNSTATTAALVDSDVFESFSYACEYCTKTFKKETKLARHLLKFHAGKKKSKLKRNVANENVPERTILKTFKENLLQLKREIGIWWVTQCLKGLSINRQFLPTDISIWMCFEAGPFKNIFFLLNCGKILSWKHFLSVKVKHLLKVKLPMCWQSLNTKKLF